MGVFSGRDFWKIGHVSGIKFLVLEGFREAHYTAHNEYTVLEKKVTYGVFYILIIKSWD